MAAITGVCIISLAVIGTAAGFGSGATFAAVALVAIVSLLSKKFRGDAVVVCFDFV